MRNRVRRSTWNLIHYRISPETAMASLGPIMTALVILARTLRGVLALLFLSFLIQIKAHNYFKYYSIIISCDVAQTA